MVKKPKRSSNPRVRAAQEYAQLRWRDSRLRVPEIAEHVGISVYRLQLLFKKHLKTTVGRYVRELRAREAQQAMIELGATAGEAAGFSGFGSASTGVRAMVRFAKPIRGRVRVAR